MARILFHVDLNAFFAAAEELRHPELRGKPLAIGSIRSRGVLATANYAARQHGVHSAMPTAQAISLCRELVILPADQEYYRSLSARFFDILHEFTPLVEKASIDEAYLDVTDTIRNYRRPLDLAVAIQQEVKDRLGLDVSIGVAPTRFLAKVASGLKKPRGISVLRKSEIKSKLWPLPIEKVHGLGQKNAELIRLQGMETIGELALEQNRPILEPILKNRYTGLLEAITGKSSDRLKESTARKSISHSLTFPMDLYAIEELKARTEPMIEQLFERLSKAGQWPRTLSIQLRDARFENRVHTRSFPRPINSLEDLHREVNGLIDEHFEPVGYRLLGIRASGLQSASIQQKTLFEGDMTQHFIDTFNRQLEGVSLMKTSDLLKEDQPDG